MRYSNVCLEAVGYHLPEHILSSEAIEKKLTKLYKKLYIPMGRLFRLTGIKSRRIWPPGTRPSRVSAEACEHALSRSNCTRDQIELLIHTGVCRDATEPATASIIHNNLGLKKDCIVFDVSNACLGFLNGLTIAANMIALGQIDRAMVVSGENAGPIYEDTISRLDQDPTMDNFRKSLASLTLGSGAVSYILCHKKLAPDAPSLLGWVAQADSKSYNLCEGHGDIHHQSMRTDTEQLLSKGLELSRATWELFKQEMSWDNQSPDHIIHHQVSRTHQEKIFDILNINKKLGYSDIETLGNTGTVATVLSLALRAEKKLFKKGEKLAILGIGSGINCLMLGVEW